MFGRVLVLRESRNLELDYLFEFELINDVPPSLIDELARLRKGNKAVIVKCLSAKAILTTLPDLVLVDTGQLLYNIVWPVNVTIEILTENCAGRLFQYPTQSEFVFVFV